MKINTNNDELIINPGSELNSSLTNQIILENTINTITEQTKKIAIITDYLRKEYDATLLKGLKEYKTKDPVNEFLNGRKELEKTNIIIAAKKIMKKGMNSNDIYNKLLQPKVIPLFINATINEKEGRIINEYQLNESIIKIKNNGTDTIYELTPPELTSNQEIIKRVSELLKKIEGTEVEIGNFRDEVMKIIKESNETDTIKEITKRHSIGFGLLDIIFEDPNIEDVYIYSSNNNVHVRHTMHGDCITNIELPAKAISAIATKIRAISGRPFDESFPVIDFEIKEYNVRVCGVMEPLTFNGTGYAFRKHKNKPWTLEDFVENGMISLEIAGLLNFLVDGQCSILITGPRGSGKTSLLSALISEISVNQRIIVIEDTPELPVERLSLAGYKIQHLRVKPHSKNRSTSYELSAEEALRTSLRLGESVLIIGEVRGEEAKALFEAMRVGMAGNVVMGTIHGSSAYDTFDRVVHDLNVPPTSFKATDIIISCANLRLGESLKTEKKITVINEVKKDWVNNPMQEKGFNEITKFDKERKNTKISDNLEQSATIKRIAELKGMTIKECMESIKLRTKAKELIIKLRIKREPEIMTKINNKITELLSTDKKNLLTELRKYLNTIKKEQ